MTMSEERRLEAGGWKLDAAIDDAVRQMLDVEPPAGLRARVIDQLPVSGSRRPASGFRLPLFGFGVALAAAILVLAVLLPRRAAQPIAPVTVATTQPPSAPALQPEPVRPPEPISVAQSPARRPTTHAGAG